MSTPRQLPSREIWDLGDGHLITNVHSRALCANHCPLHDPSDHRMRSWDMDFDQGRMLIVRICEHGLAYADPDSRAYCEKTNSLFSWTDPDCCP